MSLAERFYDLERKLETLEKSKQTEQETKKFKFPFKFNWKFKRSLKKVNSENMLVWFLNKKNEIEPPQFMPVFDNMIIYKHKVYEFDPRAIWTLKGVKGNPRCYIIKEIDMRPVMNRHGEVVFTSSGRRIYTNAAVSNLDVDSVREEGFSTEDHPLLLKASLMAHLQQQKKKPVNWMIIGIVGIVAIGGLIWFFSK